MNWNIGIFILFFSIGIHAKVLIITHHYNRPDFIKIQYETFKKFLKDEYEFVVFNDSDRNKDMSKKIQETCRSLNIKCITISQSLHDRPYQQRWPGETYNDPSVRHTNGIKYSLDILGFDFNGVVMLIDSDMFLVKNFSVEEFMHDLDIAALPQRNKHVNYIWPGLVFMNMNTMPNKKTINFNCGRAEDVGLDTGGHTYYYLKNNPELRIKYLGNYYSGSNELDPAILKEQYKIDDYGIKLLLQQPHDVEFLIDGHFFHYRCGSNWNNWGPQYIAHKTRLFEAYIKEVLNN